LRERAPIVLALASYNVHACVGRDRRFDPGRVAAVLEELDADVVALQELESRPEQGADLLEHLGARLGLTAVHGPTMIRAHRSYGNALLIRGSVVSLLRHDLSIRPREPRGAIEAEVMVRDRPLRVIGTHFGLSRRERVRQAARLVERVRVSVQPPTLLLGDLNEWLPWAAPLRIVRRRFDAAAAPATYPAGLPLLALDRMWIHRGGAPRLDVRRHDSPLARRASDHLPLHGTLSLDAAVPGGSPAMEG
jgi:endonuclease/exonuclease/phosphatase family metal-dependent hydrolase